MLIVADCRTNNIRELTKKEKILRLNMKSWIISAMTAIIANGLALGFLYSVLFFFGLVTFFYIIEFFDDDIVDIAVSNLAIKTGISTYYP